MGIGARWKHFKIYVELTANFALLIFPSLEGVVKVLGGIWIVLCLWEGRGMQLQHKVVPSVRNRLLDFLQIPIPKQGAAWHRWGCSHIPELLRVFLGSLQSQLLSCI